MLKHLKANKNKWKYVYGQKDSVIKVLIILKLIYKFKKYIIISLIGRTFYGTGQTNPKIHVQEEPAIKTQGNYE